MELIDRERQLSDLTALFSKTEQGGSGHAVFVTGEAGSGKTSLINCFIHQIESKAKVLAGACDPLFTPRPLGPLYDISTELGSDFQSLLRTEKDRFEIFSHLATKINQADQPVVLLFEDIHWADEATLDLIKFLCRRIQRFNLFFLLTFRDSDLVADHPLVSLFGDLPSHLFSKVSLKQFSPETVDQLAEKYHYPSGPKLFALTGGNPFYVMEVLSSKTAHIPEKVKDSVLSVFRSKDDRTQALWELLSIVPSRISMVIASRVQQEAAVDMDACIMSGVLVVRAGTISFKHELFRIAIEESLSPNKRKMLHKKMVSVLQEEKEARVEWSQLVHHAYHAEEWYLVATYAPLAAQEAAGLGAHRQAVTLYQMAIEHNNAGDTTLAELYERHAYECYLTYNISAAIRSQLGALAIWRESKNTLREGDVLRFLSRLYWYDGNHSKAMEAASKSIEVLENGFPTRERAWAYSNYAQLFMLSENRADAITWGNKAIDLATRMGDNEVLSHALNNVGTIMVKYSPQIAEGESLLARSLELARTHNYHEHIARAYVNHIVTYILTKNYAKAQHYFDPGFRYCQDHDLDFLSFYMLNAKAQMIFELGKWEEASGIGQNLLNNKHHLLVKIGALTSLALITMRRGEFETAERMLQEAKSLALPTQEAQRIAPVYSALLEFDWLTGKSLVTLDEVKLAEESLFFDRNYSWPYSTFSYWITKKNLPIQLPRNVMLERPYECERQGNWTDAAKTWKELGCPYEQALALFNGTEEEQRDGLHLLESLGATATITKLKAELKSSGARYIPRGLRESTRKNPALLTTRQVEILILLQEGATYKEIADKLFISPKTVDHHISAILSKLAVNSRSKAVIEAKKLGII